MSAEHWGTLPFDLQRDAPRPSQAMNLLANLAHVMGRALSGDDCQGCAQLLVWARLEAFFDAWSGDFKRTPWQYVQPAAHCCPRHAAQDRQD